MRKLTITSEMSANEQRARTMINHTLDYIKDENNLKNWLLDQVTGVIIDGMVITYPWLAYGAALDYFKEITQ